MPASQPNLPPELHCLAWHKPVQLDVAERIDGQGQQKCSVCAHSHSA